MSEYKMTLSTSHPISALEAWQVVVIVLKLCGVIDWSWWLVLLPIEAIGIIATVMLIGFGWVAWSQGR